MSARTLGDLADAPRTGYSGSMEEAACIAAGFFVTKPAARGARRSPDLLPPQLVSLSRCIAPSYQVFWGWDVEKHKAEAFAFGIPADRVSELHPWEKTHGITYPNVFHSLDDARAFVVAFLPAPHDVIILGASLPLALTDEFLVHHKHANEHLHGHVLRNEPRPHRQTAATRRR